MWLKPMVLAAAVVAALGDCSALEHHDCPAACGGAGAAIFNLSCTYNDLASVVATGPCSMPDAGLTWYTGAYTQSTVSVTSSGPGTCHVQLGFASGFTYSADVVFAKQTPSSDQGCPPCPAYVGPTSAPLMVDNPSATCREAGAD